MRVPIAPIKVVVTIILMITPLAYGSVLPIWQWFWALTVGLLGAYQAWWMFKYRVPLDLSLIRKPLLVLCVSVIGILVYNWMHIDSSSMDGLFRISREASNYLVYDGSIIDPFAGLQAGAMFLAHLIFFVLLYLICDTKKNRDYFLKVILISAALYALYGFVIRVFENDVLLGLYSDEGTTLSSVFVNPNNFATYIGVALMICLGFLLQTIMNSSTIRGTRSKLAVVTNGQVLALVSICYFLVTALLLSSSRAAFVAAIIGVSCFAYLSFQKKNLVYQGFMGLAGLAAFITIVDFSGQDVLSRLQVITVMEARPWLYSFVIDTIWDRPFLGYGLGAFEHLFKMHRTPDVWDYYVRAHNDYLELVQAIGIPLTAIMLLSVLWLLRGSWFQLFKSNESDYLLYGCVSGLLFVFTHALVDFPFQIPAISYQVTVVFAVTVHLLGAKLESR